MKRFLPVILIFILILALTITGCGGGSSSGPPPTSGMTLGMVQVSGDLSFPTDSDQMTMLYDNGGETCETSYGGPGSAETLITIPHAYDIAQTDVTYEQWSTIYIWATTKAADKYSFANAGVMGGGNDADGGNSDGGNQQPVTHISWRDAMIWCNALTEYYNAKNGKSYACVYCTADHSTPIRSVDKDAISTATQADGGEDNPYVNPKAKGFRLPTNNEWELAARYIGTTAPTVSPLSTDALQSPSGFYWTPGNYASGATAPTANAAVAVYNAGTTAIVGSKTANALGLYDMSGNVWKWCFDWYQEMASTQQRVIRGFGYKNSSLFIGGVSEFNPKNTSFDIGFRPVRTAP